MPSTPSRIDVNRIRESNDPRISSLVIPNGAQRSEESPIPNSRSEEVRFLATVGMTNTP